MWPNPQETADLVTFTEEILNGKLHFSAGFGFIEIEGDIAKKYFKTISSFSQVSNLCFQKIPKSNKLKASAQQFSIENIYVED